ncbi:MAG TPA: CGNR zinc finger domain-containing protein [Pyrinomonadaceae bacterium]
MNSDFNDLRAKSRIDRLDEAAWRREFLRRWKLGVSPKITESILEQLKNLRDTMWRITAVLAVEKAPAKRDLKKLNEFVSLIQLRGQVFYQEGKFEFKMIPPIRDWNWVIVEIAADFARLLADFDLQRIRICANEDCRFAFYDSSKSGGKLYCRDACSLLARVHRFRQRQKLSERATAN